MSRNNVLLVVVLVLLAVLAGWFGRGLMSHEPGAHHDMELRVQTGPCPGGAAPLYWKAPMDPNYVRDRPGKSPMGMDLVPECAPAADAGADGAVVIDPATLQNIGVRTFRVERRDLVRSVRAVGRVAYDERRVTQVQTKTRGWVEKLHVDSVGQKIRRGQPLLEIYSPELVATQEELLLAARYREATAESPFEDVRGGGESLFEATKRKLALLDVPERDIERLLRTEKVDRTLTLYAPTSGVVTDLGVRAGMEVAPHASLYTVADLSRVWILADIYEYELPWIALGQTASVELNYLPGERLQAEVSYIAPFLDPKSRTIEVRLELDNATGRLRPGMFGNAVIEGSPRPGTLAVSSDAVIRSGTRTLVILSLDEGRFEPREIELGIDSGDGWLEVTEGLEEGDRIVVSSQFLIDSESNLQEALNRIMAGRKASAE